MIYSLNLPIGLYFGEIAFGLVFFCLGFLLKEKQYQNTVFAVSIPVYLGLLVYLFISSFQNGYDTIALQPYPLVRLFNLAGCIVINNVFKRIPRLQLPILATIGKESMTLLVTHFIVISMFIYSNGVLWHLSDRFLFILVIASLAILLPLFVRIFNLPRFQWMVGKKLIAINYSNESVIAFGIAGIMIAMTVYVLFKVFAPVL